MNVDSKLGTLITDAQNIVGIITSTSSGPLATKVRILATAVISIDLQYLFNKFF